jgi:hypothetical protein
MTRILETPYTEDELRDLSKDGRERVAGVVAVAWHELLGRDQDRFEEEVSRRLTGSRYGLADLGIRLVGCLGQDMLLEASGDVSMLLGDYEAIMAEEAADTTGGDDVS